MSTSNVTSTVSPTNANKPSSQALKKSKRIVLRLRPELLATWLSDTPTRKATKSESSASSTPVATPSIQQATESVPADRSSESNATPLPNGSNGTAENNNLAPPSANPLKRKSLPGSKPGSKRSSSLGVDALPKPRGKPGPKKKPRLDDGTIDNSTPTANKVPFTGVAPISTHKLGPKANQGAINAGLRALDRSMDFRPRKWVRTGFQVKSFTGVAWSVGSWRAPKSTKPEFSGDVKSDTTDSSETKLNNNASSAVASDKSNGGGDVEMPNAPVILASSPAPS
ncbi:INO80 complex, subunit Ies4 [Cryomyces antarcticus]|nr:hypothetical protein LTR39_000732 [Cryomyces antarcticus]